MSERRCAVRNTLPTTAGDVSSYIHRGGPSTTAIHVSSVDSCAGLKGARIKLAASVSSQYELESHTGCYIWRHDECAALHTRRAPPFYIQPSHNQHAEPKEDDLFALQDDLMVVPSELQGRTPAVGDDRLAVCTIRAGTDHPITVEQTRADGRQVISQPYIDMAVAMMCTFGVGIIGEKHAAVGRLLDVYHPEAGVHELTKSQH
ncbi:uncharacterized protein B0H18DRAFT_963829 [Fomitopsis serialis]|uniref:uncharacterized protein n=1 Tax=Fomitopsis serialis TaxID=139415 RepID=UPI0020085BA9|nr:uncharacterized protein B0H18DRAFT_963829 [Neoantrodia serialis]KAH9910136.1 hypothetical protein B0H18DRAFT_963829 [Neoantrodia serialis]